jgi:ABC-type uncharacterized transport system substrate-binding protein
MTRRTMALLVTFTLAILMTPLAAEAQQATKVSRIGWLSPSFPRPDHDPPVDAFRQGLRAPGYVEGQHLVIEYRGAEGRIERLPDLAAELVQLQVAVIVAVGTAATRAAQDATHTIPIVMTGTTDPVAQGFVASLARPGGNITGLLLYEEGITGKWLAMLKEIAPSLSRAALIANPDRTPYDYFVRSAKSVASSLAIELAPSPVKDAADIERAIVSFSQEANGSLVILPGTATEHRNLVIGLAARQRLPAVYYARFFVTAGGLMSYGTDFADQSRQAASYVDRILRGARPADLPVQAPTRYQTTLNLKTAKALGLDVPPSLLVRADEVIE